MELVRSILIQLEDSKDRSVVASAEHEHGDTIFNYHLEIMADAGLLRQFGKHGDEFRMTWQGHEFVDSVRDPEIWRKTLEGAETAKGFTFELLRDLAKGFLRTKLKEHTGVDI
jgi:hypothetical protein